jgi:hypothetical protein
MPRRLKWPRYGLRTLLLSSVVLGAALGWWFRPFTLVNRWPNGQLQSELHVRRSWNGALLTNGPQRWWWSNGQLARDGESRDEPLPKIREQLALVSERRWDVEGVPIRGGAFWIDWLVAIRLDEAPPPVDWSLYRFTETEHDP